MIGVALIAMLAAVSLGAAAPARADDLPRLPPPDPDCSKKYVIESARGWNATFESDDFGDNHISSRYVSAVTSELITTEPDVGSADIAQYNVNVPNSDASGYTGAVNQGAANLAAEIHKNAACGPNRPTLILIGYSQGANVVKQTLNNIASSPDADIIGAAINIGEPTRSNDNRALATSGHMNTVNPDWSPGSPASPDAGGLLDQIPVPNPFADDGRFFDLCRNDDIVCNSAVSGIGNPDAQPLNAVTFAVFDNPGHHSYNEEPRGGVGDQMAQRATARAVALRNKTNSPPPPPPDTTQPDSGTPQVTTPEATVPQVTVPPVTVPPVTTPPVTTPLVTTPPVTTPPGTTPAVTTPPVTIPPVTTPSVTAPPPNKTPPPGSVAPPPPDKGVPGPTVYQENAWGRRMNIRRFATTDSRVIAVLKGPTEVDVQCQVHGQRVIYGSYDNDGWSYLPAYGGWLSNIFISRNKMVPRVPDCESTKAPKTRADVPRVQLPTSVTPAPEVLKPFQLLSTPPAPKSRRTPAPKPTRTATTPTQTRTTPPQLPQEPVSIPGLTP